MTDISSSFDVVKGVEFKETTKLFYGVFPFKVMVLDPTPKPVYDPFFDWKSVAHMDQLHRHAKARATFIGQRRRTLNALDLAPKSFRFMDNGKTLSYFFLKADDAVAFMKKNRAHVSCAFRPSSQSYVDALLSEANTVVRDRPFWNCYRYRIQFKRDEEATQAADEFFALHFQSEKRTKRNSARVMYNYDHDRVIYLNDENDVVFTKMGLGEYFKSFTKAILKEEISDAHEPLAGPQAD